MRPPAAPSGQVASSYRGAPPEQLSASTLAVAPAARADAAPTDEDFPIHSPARCPRADAPPSATCAPAAPTTRASRAASRSRPKRGARSSSSRRSPTARPTSARCTRARLLFEPAVHPKRVSTPLQRRPVCLPGPSDASGLAYAPRSAARAAWRARRRLSSSPRAVPDTSLPPLSPTRRADAGREVGGAALAAPRRVYAQRARGQQPRRRGARRARVRARARTARARVWRELVTTRDTPV